MYSTIISTTYLLFPYILILHHLRNCSGFASTESEITIYKLQQHIKYLTSGTLQKRHPGNENSMMASVFIKRAVHNYMQHSVIKIVFKVVR